MILLAIMGTLTGLSVIGAVAGAVVNAGIAGCKHIVHGKDESDKPTNQV